MHATRRHLVVGAAVAAVAGAEWFLAAGDSVIVTDRRPSEALDRLASAGATVLVADPPPVDLLTDVDDVLVSPGVPPHDALAAAAVSAGLDVYSEPELAWRDRGPGAPPWLAVTGTNGKSTVVTMLAAILAAAGRRTAALGNIGVPLLGSARASDGLDVLAVELSSFQLYWSSSLAPQVGAFLNAADDHLEWHRSFGAYVAAKFDIWRAATPEAGGIAIGNLDDQLVAAGLAGVRGRRVGFTLGEPAAGQLGVVDGVLVDRVDWPTGALGTATGEPYAGVALVDAALIRPPGQHNVANALAAAAMARAYGVPPEAVRDGLAGYQPEPHRNATVATIDGVTYVDDSKATNPHAAAASLAAYPSIVWVAGGQLKGVDVNELVASVAGRLRGAVLLGVDRADVAAALARHAPDVPVVDVPSTDDKAMGEAVVAAAGLAHPGDTVLLAPAAASKDMYASFGARGDAFVAAVRALDRSAGGTDMTGVSTA
ncbi:MAG TPA: UDP-N-acetylmuramoyl-L-alanine--D-glutamate ligase [Micromonosporaceae bacterium]|nr:UDP-N-acetylmuramoyl-L-alanine--D-glutamate ligase [Micromonosporaceae bacterium]